MDSERIHRQIMLSRAYQLAPAGPTAGRRGDGANALLWHFPRRRLAVEEMRDAMLAVSGDLDRGRSGPHPFPPEEKWNGLTQHTPFVADYVSSRRTVYLMQQRIRKQPLHLLFDGADTNASTAVRAQTITPLQALFMMNAEFLHQRAERFAARMVSAKTTDVERITQGFLLAFGRPPTPAETRSCEAHLRMFSEQLAASVPEEAKRRQSAWASVARVLLSSNEFIFVD